jgi:hypothetical protein
MKLAGLGVIGMYKMMKSTPPVKIKQEQAKPKPAPVVKKVIVKKKPVDSEQERLLELFYKHYKQPQRLK